LRYRRAEWREVAVRFLVMALVLAAMPGGASAPKVLGPEAPAAAYASLPIAGLRPMTAAEVERVLRLKRSYPEHSRVPVWHQRNASSRLLSFGARGKASDGDCDPAACAGRYTVSGNIVTVDFKRRRGVMRLRFYLAPDGVAMVADDWGPKDGRASAW
jgi:hypothetical protein